MQLAMFVTKTARKWFEVMAPNGAPVIERPLYNRRDPSPDVAGMERVPAKHGIAGSARPQTQY